MIQRMLDTNNDWVFGQGLQNFARGEDAMILNITTRLREWKRDCFYAQNEGVDYVNFLSIGTKNLLDADLRRVMLQSDGVISLTTYSSSLDTSLRILTVTATIRTIYGTITYSEVV